MGTIENAGSRVYIENLKQTNGKVLTLKFANYVWLVS